MYYVSIKVETDDKIQTWSTLSEDVNMRDLMRNYPDAKITVEASTRVPCNPALKEAVKIASIALPGTVSTEPSVEELLSKHYENYFDEGETKTLTDRYLGSLSALLKE